MTTKIQPATAPSHRSKQRSDLGGRSQAMRGRPFQRRVWEKLKAISAGKSVSYMDLAKWTSLLTSPRAVAHTCAANPIAPDKPITRVVRTNGDLAGYRWGIERKRELIHKEAIA